MAQEIMHLPSREAGLVNSLLTSLSFLTSPIVEIIVGEGDKQTTLTAHQTLLLDSPFLTEFVNKFDSTGPVSVATSAIAVMGIQQTYSH
jgi:hypothetical protein